MAGRSRRLARESQSSRIDATTPIDDARLDFREGALKPGQDIPTVGGTADLPGERADGRGGVAEIFAPCPAEDPFQRSDTLEPD
jgi:hypothetical protein